MIIDTRQAVITAAKELVKRKVQYKGAPPEPGQPRYRYVGWTKAELALYRAVQLLEAEEAHEQASHNDSV